MLAQPVAQIQAVGEPPLGRFQIARAHLERAALCEQAPFVEVVAVRAHDLESRVELFAGGVALAGPAE